MKIRGFPPINEVETSIVQNNYILKLLLKTREGLHYSEETPDVRNVSEIISLLLYQLTS